MKANMKSSFRTPRRSFAPRGIVSILSAAAILIAATVSPAVAGGRDDRKVKIFPPHSHPYGKSYAEWNAAFWQWSLALPVEGHPFLDTPEFDFSAGQSGKVWFVGAPDGPITRQVTLPEGKALFLTIRDVETSTLEEPPFFGATEEEQRANSEWFADRIVDVFCIIDGVPVRNLQAYRFSSPQFEFTAPTPWIFGATGGTGTAVGDGYFLMIELPRGKHTIHFGGTFRFSAEDAAELGWGDEGFDLPHDVTIEVTVGKERRPGGHHDDDDDQDDCRRDR